MVRTLLIAALFVCICAMVAPDAAALTQDWGGLEDDWSMPTGTKFNGPTVVECRAIGSQNQRCRDCRTQYDENGQPTELGVVCAYVAEQAYCACKFPNGGRDCTAYGKCIYS